MDLFTASVIFLIFPAACGLGYVTALTIIARDQTWKRVPDDCLIVKRDVFEKLQEVAEVKKKNPSLKFDSRGVPTGVMQGDDDEES